MNPTPRNPYAVLAAALVLPGSGHVLLGLAQRGLMFLFFTVILGWAGAHLMPEDSTFLGRHIGGLFIYGLSVIDAYKLARIRWEKWKYAEQHHQDSSVK